MPDYRIYDLTITTLTPVHIGTGRVLLHEYDYAIHARKTWVINQSALLDAQKDVENLKVAERLATIPPAQLLREPDFRPGSPFFRYVLQGQPCSSGEGIEIQEQFKDVFDGVYLPGSGVKGALRTVIGWQAWKELGLEPDSGRLKPRREWAGSAYEQQIFGRDPNNDFMRALQVSDSEPRDTSCLFLLNARVVNPGGAQSVPVEMEAIGAESVFKSTVKLDLALFSDWAKHYRLTLAGENWLVDIPRIANAHAREILEGDIAWFKGLKNGREVLEICERLRQAQLGPTQFLLRLGWGTGWDDKTFGARLKADPDFMEYIIYQYRMTKGERESGDPFPRSRRAAFRLQRTTDGSVVETPVRPLGWILVDMQARS